MTIEIADGTLKAVYGDYVIYKRDYLIKHLAREIYLLVSYERWKVRMKQEDIEELNEALKSVEERKES